MKRKTGLFIVFVAVALVIGFLLSRESFYAKQTVGEWMWNTFTYSVGSELSMAISAVKNDKTFVLNLPLYRQEHRVTCEVAALRMALGRYLIEVSEDDLLASLTFDTKDPMRGGVWGDPDAGFVGDPDGALSKYTGYGVYEYPIRNLARLYRQAEVLENPDINTVVNLVSKGKPVIVWNVISKHRSRYWQTVDGKEIEAHPGEHARVVVGFIGEVTSPERLILHDPIYGRIVISIEKFLGEWESLGKKAVVVN